MRSLCEKCCRPVMPPEKCGSGRGSVHSPDLNLSDGRSYDLCITFHFFPGRSMQPAEKNAVSVGEALKEIVFGAADHFRDSAEGIVIVEFTDDRRAELIWHASFQKKGNASLNSLH